MKKVSLLQNTLNTRWIRVNNENTCAIRSDKLDRCSKEEILTLKKLGIQAIIDLREDPKNKISPFILESGLKYHNIPIAQENIYEYYDSIGISKDVDSRRIAKADYYVHLLSQHEEAIKNVLKLWIEYDGHILIHCSLGRDRTGIISAIIQKAMGATDEEIISEYALSASNLEPLKLDGDKYIDTPTSEKICEIFLIKAQPLLETYFKYVKSLMFAEMIKIIGTPPDNNGNFNDKKIIVGEKPYDNQAYIVRPYPTGFYNNEKIPEVAFLSHINTQSMFLIVGVLTKSIDKACLLIKQLRQKCILLSVFAEFLYEKYGVVLINRYSTNGKGRKNRDKQIIPLINKLKQNNVKILSVGKNKTKAYSTVIAGCSLEIIHCSAKNISKPDYLKTYFYREASNARLTMQDFCIYT